MSEFTIFEAEAAEFQAMSVAHLIEWLQEIAEDSPFPADQIMFEVEQWGDQWDGYSIAELKITRPMTEAEKQDQADAWAAAQREREAKRKAEERAEYERLKQKYG